MKKMVLINQSTGYLMIDIVNAYADRYDSVSLIAGSIKMTERSLKDIVKVDKIIAYNRESFLKRLFTWCWGTIQIFFKLLFNGFFMLTPYYHSNSLALIRDVFK